MKKRPSSAQRPAKPSEMKNKANSRYKQNTNQNLDGGLSSGQKLMSEQWEMPKPSVMKLKTLGILHAYRPGLLKECLVSEKTAIAKYAGGGECNLNDIFIKTALALFRDWKDKIHANLAFLVEAITTSEDVLEPSLEARIREAITELKQYSNKIKQQIEELCAKGENFKLQRLREKYTLLLETTEHVLKLVDCMRALSSEVEEYLRQKEGARDSEVEAGVRAIAERHEAQAADSLNFCACHPDNRLLLRLEFKVRAMLQAATRKVKAIFQSLRELQRYELHFRKQVMLLEGLEDFSHEYLSQVLEVLYSKNEEIKAIEKRFQVAKMPEFTSLRNIIEDWETSFIQKLRKKSVVYLRQALRTLNATRTLHLVKGKGREYIEIKKRILLLGKVYLESEKESNIAAQYYDFEKKAVSEAMAALSQAVSPLSSATEQLQLKIDALQALREKATLSALKLVERERQIVGEMESAQGEAWAAVNTVYLKLSRIEGANAELVEEAPYNDSKLLDKLHQLVSYSRSEEQNHEIFKHLRSPPPKPDTVDAMLLAYDSAYALHLQFARGLEAGIESARQLREVLREELIEYLFREEFKGELVGGYGCVRQVWVMEERVAAAAGKEHINGVLFRRYSAGLVEEIRRAVNEEIKKLEGNKHKPLLNRYLILLYECNLLQLLNVRPIYALTSAQHAHLPYRNVLHEYGQAYEASLARSRREETAFGAITAQVYSICAMLNQENKLICEYYSSRHTNQYFPSSAYLTEWMALEFAAEIYQNVSSAAVSAKREEAKLLFEQFCKRMETQREKLLVGNPKAESKDIYQHITANIAALRQLTFEEDYQQLLLKLIRYLQVLNLPHCAVFAKDELPLSLMVAAGGRDEVNQLILSMLRLTHNKSIPLTPFQPRETTSILPSQKEKVVSPIANIMNKAEEMEEQMMEEVIEEQGVVEEMEELIEEIDDALPISSVVKPTLKQEPIQPASALASLPTIRLFNYFKIDPIENLSQLKNCLQYHNNQYLTFQSKLDLRLFCQTDPKGRSALATHIKQVLDEVAKKDLLRLMNLTDSIPDCEYQLTHFQQTLREGRDCRKEMLQLLTFFKVDRKVLYQQKGNFIESFRKQNQQAAFLNSNLVENCYRLDLGSFQVDELMSSLWRAIEFGSQGTLPPSRAEVCSRIDQSNALLRKYYSEVNQRIISGFNETHTNRREIEKQVATFLQLIFNKMRQIDPLRGDLLAFATSLEANLREVAVIQPYITLRLDGRALFVSSTQITQKIIASCLLLPALGDQFSRCVWYGEDGSPSVASPALADLITAKTQVQPMEFSFIQAYLISAKKEILVEQAEARDKELLVIQSFRSYSKAFDGALQKRLAQAEAMVRQAKQIIIYLNQKDLGKVRRVEEYRAIREVRMVESSRATQSISYEPSFLQELLKQLEAARVSLHCLLYDRSIIALTQTASKVVLAERLSISNSRIAQLESQLVSESNRHTLKKLYITLCGAVPLFDNFDSAVQSRVREYLKDCRMELRQGAKAVAVVLKAVFQGGNTVEMETEWPRQSITVDLITPFSTVSFTIPSNSYCYFADIELLSLRAHLTAQYDLLKKAHLAEIRRREEEAHEAEMRRQEQASQLQRIEQERQLQKLRAEEEKARLQFGTDELKRKNRERQAAENARLRFIEEITLNKLRQQQEQEMRQEQQRLSNKIGLISGGSDPNKEDMLEFEISLSEGQDERYNGDRHCQQYDVEYDYRLTLYEHIRHTYHTLRTKSADVDHWLQHP